MVEAASTSRPKIPPSLSLAARVVALGWASSSIRTLAIRTLLAFLTLLSILVVPIIRVAILALLTITSSITKAITNRASSISSIIFIFHHAILPSIPPHPPPPLSPPLTKILPKANGRTGHGAYGILTWKGRRRATEEKIAGTHKTVWKIVDDDGIEEDALKLALPDDSDDEAEEAEEETEERGK